MDAPHKIIRHRADPQPEEVANLRARDQNRDSVREADHDRARGFTVTDSGVVVIAKTDSFDADGSSDDWESSLRSHE